MILDDAQFILGMPQAERCQKRATGAEQDTGGSVDLRVVENAHGIRPSLQHIAGLPYDLTLGVTEACENVEELVTQLQKHTR